MINHFFAKILIRNISLKQINLTLFCIIAFMLLFLFTKRITPAIYGDGQEYFLLNQTFVNHFSPEVRPIDLQTAEKNLEERGDSSHFGYFDGINNFIKSKPKPMRNFWGAYSSYDNKIYTFHFWFYSLLNAPVTLLLKLLKTDQLRSFQLTNSIIILSILAYIIFISTLSDVRKTLATLLFLISGNSWYISWSHPEIFSSACIFLALVLLYDKRYFWSVALAAIGSYQNPPIAFLIPFIFLKMLLDNGFKWKQFIPFGCVSLMTFLPPAFYYYHFKVINLLMVENVFYHQFITLDRIHSLFFDLNQGMILSLPIILPLFLFDVIKKTIRRQWKFTLWFPIIIIAMAIPSIQQNNWNMGESIIVRYSLWMSMLIVFYFIVEFDWQTRLHKILIPIALITQLTTVLVFGGFTPSGRQYVIFNSGSTWVLNHHPSWYNPEPEIFGERVLQHEGIDSTDSPIIYYDANKNPTKMMVHKSRIDSLKHIGFDNQAIINKLKTSRFRYGWTYYDFK